MLACRVASAIIAFETEFVIWVIMFPIPGFKPIFVKTDFGVVAYIVEPFSNSVSIEIFSFGNNVSIFVVFDKQSFTFSEFVILFA